jgi:tetratricopeptide (TPR) repeat protein
VASVGWLAFVPATISAQDTNAAKFLGQTKDKGALPLWSSPTSDARQDLGKAARSSERGLFLVGHPKVGTGTAWVISRQRRLLVTNAHVADMFHLGKGNMLAIPSGTAQLYTVDRVWYHPGVRRFGKDVGGLSIRSVDPNDGDIDPHSPDLALLQLGAGGPDLTVEFPLATNEELGELFAQPAAIMGFPGHDTKGWPALGEKAAATIHDGVISRLTDFQMNPSVPAAELQFLQYTMATWPGFSGSPVFLPNGHVAAVHNMASPEEGRYKQIITIPHGIRADCVLEMLVHHGLDDQLPFTIDKSKLSVDRWTKPDERSEKARADYAKAAAMVAEAEKLTRYKKEFQAAETLCNDAMQLTKNYARAYYVRALTRVNFKFENSKQLSRESALGIIKAAHEDAIRSVQLDPSDPYNVIIVCVTLNQLGFTSDDQSHFRRSLEILQDLLKSDNLPAAPRGSAMSMRANAYDNLGDVDAALRDHNEAIRLNPENPNTRDNRGRFLQGRELGDFGEADFAKAREIRAKVK